VSAAPDWNRRLQVVLGSGEEEEPGAEERLRQAADRIERERQRTRRGTPELPTVYYRTPRGGQVPLDARQRRELLHLYAGFGIPVAEIAEQYGTGTSTIYRWLALLGVQPQDRATGAELDRMREARELARKARRHGK
jgi:DNA invertase Pin-like site-specific DNA recombinase